MMRLGRIWHYVVGHADTDPMEIPDIDADQQDLVEGEIAEPVCERWHASPDRWLIRRRSQNSFESLLLSAIEDVSTVSR